MEQIIRIGLDTSKHVFQVHGVDAGGCVVVRKQLRRCEMERFFGKLPSALIGIEACGASHHWARVLSGLGHEVKLLPPQYVKPYVKRGKNDAADAAAICEAMSRPEMRFVPVKTPDQQAALMLHGARDLLVKQRTMLVNAVRGHAAEFGVTGAKGVGKLSSLLQVIMSDPTIPALAHEVFARLSEQIDTLEKQRCAIEEQLLAWHRTNAQSRCWAHRGDGVSHEDPRPHGVPLRATLGGLDRLDTQGPFHRRQTTAGGNHACGR
jgi:transposase